MDKQRPSYAGGKVENNMLTVGLAGSFMLPQFAAMPSSVKWRFYPLPKGPAAGATVGSPPPSTRFPPRQPTPHGGYCSGSPADRTSNGPICGSACCPTASPKLYPEWVDVAIPFRDQNVEAFRSYVDQDQAIADAGFRYDAAQAYKTIHDPLGKVLNAVAARGVHPGRGPSERAGDPTVQVSGLRGRSRLRIAALTPFPRR